MRESRASWEFSIELRITTDFLIETLIYAKMRFVTLLVTERGAKEEFCSN
jgi:hypothetical protein